MKSWNFVSENKISVWTYFQISIIIIIERIRFSKKKKKPSCFPDVYDQHNHII